MRGIGCAFATRLKALTAKLHQVFDRAGIDFERDGDPFPGRPGRAPYRQAPFAGEARAVALLRKRRIIARSAVGLCPGGSSPQIDAISGRLPVETTTSLLGRTEDEVGNRFYR